MCIYNKWSGSLFFDMVNFILSVLSATQKEVLV